MGYVYDARTGQLCCDSCGKHGGVRRVRCKYGYCQALALCADCRKGDTLKQFRQHCEKNCKEAAAEFAAREAEKEAALAAGHYVFCASVYTKGSDQKRVDMTFRNRDGETLNLTVATEVREKFHWRDVTTYDDVLAAV